MATDALTINKFTQKSIVKYQLTTSGGRSTPILSNVDNRVKVTLTRRGVNSLNLPIITYFGGIADATMGTFEITYLGADFTDAGYYDGEVSLGQKIIGSSPIEFIYSTIPNFKIVVESTIAEAV